LPENFGDLTALDWLIRKAQITELHLSNTQIAKLPKSFDRLTQLKILTLPNTLRSLPENIGNLTALEELDLSKTQITALPESFGQLTQLTRLHLPFTLNSLPKSIGNLTALRKLYLSKKQITALSESLNQLTELTRLECSKQFAQKRKHRQH
jgi:Leucine-rich repeat (LRR) protein